MLGEGKTSTAPTAIELMRQQWALELLLRLRRLIRWID
jgi:hypothetical protein